MGAGSSSRLASLRKTIRENDPSITEVSLDRLQLSDKTVRKLSNALRQNRLARIMPSVKTCMQCVYVRHKMCKLFVYYGLCMQWHTPFNRNALLKT